MPRLGLGGLKGILDYMLFALCKQWQLIAADTRDATRKD